MTDTQQRRGWMLAATGMLLVSTDSLFIRLAETNAWNMAVMVAAFSLPIYVGLAWKADHRASPAAVRVYLVPLVLAGVLGGASQLAFIGAVNRTTVANVVAIVAAAPVVAAFAAWFFFDEATSRRVWLAIVVTATGVFVIVAGSLGSPTLDGDALAVLAIVAFALSINVWRRFPEMSVYVGLAIGATIMGVVAAPFATPGTIDGRALACAFAMGVVFNPLGRICHSTAPRYAPAAEVALFTPIEMIAATTWAWLWFGEVPSTQTMVGAVLILGGVLYGTALAGS